MLSKNPVTIALIVLNVLVYAFMAWRQQSIGLNTNADTIAILHAGANFNPFVMEGDYWRLISCMFLHYGFLHLAVNMYGLYQLGELLEPGIGSGRYALLYFICGVAASIASLVFNTLVASAGASGAIFGLYGFMLGAQIISFYNDKQRLKQVLTSFAIFVVINALIARGVNVDMAGHIGGAVAGLIIAFCHFKLRILKTHKELAAALVAVSLLVFAVPKDQLNYFHRFGEIISLERRIDEVYKSAKSERALKDSLNQFAASWKNVENQFLDATNFPRGVQSDAAVLAKHANLRNLEIQYQLKFVDGRPAYGDSVKAVGDRIEKNLKLEHNIGYIFASAEKTNPTSNESK